MISIYYLLTNCILYDKIQFVNTICNLYDAVRQRAAEGTITETARIEMCQSLLLKTSQSQQSIVPYKVTHDQSTSSLEED